MNDETHVYREDNLRLAVPFFSVSDMDPAIPKLSF